MNDFKITPKHVVQWLVLSLTVLALCASGLAASAAGVAPAPGDPGKPDASHGKPGAGPADADASDNYGYVLETAAPAWYEAAASGVEVTFTTRDDDVAGPISLGFDFPFYERSYSELHLSTNGLISFGEASDEFVNRSMPRDTTPNDLIAPFWDDLIMLVGGSGEKISQVFVQTVNEAGGKYFVVEWRQFARLGSTDLVTFQAILHENGDIWLQYQALNGVLVEATVGIEDAHGVDGLQYLYNAPGLSTTNAVRITRPAAARRAKVTTSYMSAFTISGRAQIDLTIINSGNLGDDAYSLNFLPDQPGWQANFSTAGGARLEATGLLHQGEELHLVVNLTAPEDAAAGAFVSGEFQAVSTADTNRKATAYVQAAVPAAFAQAYYDAVLGMRLSLVWQQTLYSPRISADQFTGSNLSMTQVPGGNYVYAWEKNISVTGNLVHTNLEFTILNRFGLLLVPTRQLTNNQDALVKTEDRFLTLAGLPNGRIGAIWVRILTQAFEEDGQTVQKTNQNIYFSVLDEAGNVISAAARLTDNDEWRGREDMNVPLYISPRIVALGADRFLMAWNDERSHLDGSTADVYIAVNNASGAPVAPPAALTTSQHGGLRYNAPCLVALQDGRAVVAYVRLDPGDPQDPVDDQTRTVYVLVNGSGALVRAETELTGSAGSTPDGIQLNSGSVVLAWNMPGNGALQYAVLGGANMDVTRTTTSLATPKGREPGVVSVTQDTFGRAVLTWAEIEQSDYLSYVLLDGSGTVITPAMIFQMGAQTITSISTNMYGWGNAPYNGTWKTFIPRLER